jgi:hypothetical protein
MSRIRTLPPCAVGNRDSTQQGKPRGAGAQEEPFSGPVRACCGTSSDVQRHPRPLGPSLAIALAATGALALAACNGPRKSGGGKDDPTALSMQAPADDDRGKDRAAPAAAPPGTPAGAEEPSIDDEPAPSAAPQSGRRVASSTKSSGRRRVSGARTGHGSEPGHDEPGGELPSDAAPEGELKVTRLVVSKGVAGREPVGASTKFSAESTDKLFAFVELSNESKIEGEVYVTFSPEGGGASQKIKLDVGPEKRWRTWASSKKPRTPGGWTATVHGADGRMLARTTFEVTE